MTDSFVEKISDCATTIGILIGIIAWWFAREDASRKTAELDRYKIDAGRAISEADAKAATANKYAAEANEKAALAIKETASLNERAAASEKEAEIARLELEKLKEKQRDRVLTDEHKNQFKTATAPLEKGILDFTVVWDNDGETTRYGLLVRAMLVDSGFTVNPTIFVHLSGQGPLDPKTDSRGISIRVLDKDKAPERAKSVQAGLQAIGIISPIESEVTGRMRGDAPDVVRVYVHKKE